MTLGVSNRESQAPAGAGPRESGCRLLRQEVLEDPQAFPPLVKEQSFSFDTNFAATLGGKVLRVDSEDSYKSVSHSGIPQSVIHCYPGVQGPFGGGGAAQKEMTGIGRKLS